MTKSKIRARQQEHGQLHMKKGKPLNRYALSSEQCPQKRKKHKSVTLDLGLD